MLWQVLVQFLFQLVFGLALAMASIRPRDANSGFFRVHLWVALGLDTLIAAISGIVGGDPSLPHGIAVWGAAGATLSYVGAVLWLYERARGGRLVLALVAAVNLIAAWRVATHGTAHPSAGPGQLGFDLAQVVSSGLLLGTPLTSMLLGHWYLNTPSMKLAPLQRLIGLTLAATVLRALCSGTSLVASRGDLSMTTPAWVALLMLRWLAGLIGVATLAWMARQTLKIPNTQSATGILYVAVILAFLGELTALLLSAPTRYPL